jgi:hypothetical protein
MNFYLKDGEMARKAIDMTNQIFGKLTVIKLQEMRGCKSYWLCKCICGKEIVVSRESLRKNLRTSCRCLERNKLVGKKFGKLTITEFVHINKFQKACFNYICECGNKSKKPVVGYRLRNLKSCGCLKRNEYGVASFNSLYKHYRSNARNKKREFKLSKEDFRKLTSSNCLYCDAPPSTIFHEKHCYGPYIYNGIDRVDNSKGYILENCAPACHSHNRSKKDVTIIIMKKALEFLGYTITKGDLYV